MSRGGRRFPVTTAGKAESRRMEPRVNVITLAVDDLGRALEFYRDGLGLQTNGPVATELVDDETGAAGAIVIFKLESGVVLSLYPRSEEHTSELQSRGLISYAP